VNDSLVVHLGSIDKRLLEDPSQDDGVHGPVASLEGSSGPSQLVQRHREDRPMTFGGSGQG
jgi:hypothetical protein